MNGEREDSFEFVEETHDIVEPRNPIVIGITHGDVNGIGYEVILKSLHDKDILPLIVPVIYGNPQVLTYFQKQLQLDDFHFNTIQNTGQLHKKRINLINVYEQEIKLTVGKTSEFAGTLAVKALEQAVSDLKKETIHVVVTAPINKNSIQGKDFNFQGHTEFFAHHFNVEENDTLMFMVHDSLRIGLVTNHLPISEVSKAITHDVIVHKIKIMDHSLKRDFGIVRPKIAVLGLNPHSGDDGFLGNEEKETIKPAINECFHQKILVYGPYAADGFFGSGHYHQFDAILAMYHDQGLVAFKSIAEGEGVNFTAGLPIVRTSPAHGTAYEIAGKGEASESSMTEALFLACDIYRNREAYNEMYRNPLRIGLAQEITGSPKIDETIDPFAEEE